MCGFKASIGSPKPKLLVDERAIGTDQRGDYLLVVNDKNVVEYRPVEARQPNVGALRVIDDGIGKIDWVIVNGLQRARPGATVNPRTSRNDRRDKRAENTGGNPRCREHMAKPAAENRPTARPATKPNRPSVGRSQVRR